MNKTANSYSYNKTFRKDWCTITLFKLNNLPCTSIQHPNPEYTIWFHLKIDKRRVEYTFKYKTTNYRDLKKYIHTICDTFQKKESYQ